MANRKRMGSTEKWGQLPIGRQFDNVDQLKTELCRLWRQIDEYYCRRLIQSIPRRLRALIKKKGEELVHEDWHL